jgi:hypothetical protein
LTYSGHGLIESPRHPTSFIILSNTLEDNISDKPRPFVRVVPIDGSAINCRPFALVKKLAIMPKIGMTRGHSLQVRAANFAGRNFLHDRLNNGPCHGSERLADQQQWASDLGPKE